MELDYSAIACLAFGTVFITIPAAWYILNSMTVTPRRVNCDQSPGETTTQTVKSAIEQAEPLVPEESSSSSGSDDGILTEMEPKEDE
jgi:hypothetical protein